VEKKESKAIRTRKNIGNIKQKVKRKGKKKKDGK
jgi:hypothetical protein